MPYVVLAAWIIQASVGTWLLIGWARHGRRHAGAILPHVAVMVGTLVLWVAFLVTGAVGFAWATLAGLMIAIPFGETAMVRRSRRLRGVTKESAADYGGAIVDVFRGRMPPAVTFHAAFSAAVFFPCLGVCIGATVAAA
jgi:hypothetical protein